MERFPFRNYAQLLSDFPVTRNSIHAKSATRFDPNEFAKYGFQLAAPSATWGVDHLSFISSRCDGELSNATLADHEDAAPIWRAFTCLCLGFLLGRYELDEITDLQFTMADFQLAGLMFAQSSRIHELCTE